MRDGWISVFENTIMIQDKHVVVLGAGRSGRAAAALALANGGNVTLYDASESASFSGIDPRISTVAGVTCENAKKVHSDLLVISPGIDTYGEFVAAFAQNCGELIGETELAARLYKGKVVAITGTNGKTTTTELVQKILQQAGVSCIACGNYGVPFSEVVLMEQSPEAVALEVSSFQLETVVKFKADVSIWLNFSADHMDRYTKLDDYYKAKLNVFINQSEQDFAVIRAGEDVGPLVSRKLSFSTEDERSDYTLENGFICFEGEQVLDLSVTKMRGLHNAENTMAAIAACRCLGVDFKTAVEALRGFAPPLHRCELIRTLDGVEYLNDSKATNLHALDSALRSQTRPVVLIAGGKEKGLDYTELLPRLSKHAQAAVVYGEIAEQLSTVFSKAVPTTQVADLDNALKVARQHAQAGDVILLSPGTSSFDQYSGYEERGDHFRKIVLALR